MVYRTEIVVFDLSNSATNKPVWGKTVGRLATLAVATDDDDFSFNISATLLRYGVIMIIAARGLTTETHPKRHELPIVM